MNAQDIILHLNPFDSNDEVKLLSVEAIDDDGCRQDGLKFTFQHSDEKERILELYTDLDIDENNLISGKLNGYTYVNKITQEEFEEDSFLDRNIEILRTYLQKEITIYFDKDKEYTEKPFVVVNIEKKYESLYRTYSVEYLSSNNNQTYYGVKIIFNSLKFKTVYPGINIIIIGDKKEIGDKEDEDE